MKQKQHKFMFFMSLFLLFMFAETAQAADHKVVRGGQILNCYGWTYNQIKDNLENIKAANFSAVQVSSAQPLLPKSTQELWRGISNMHDITVYCKKESDAAPNLYYWFSGGECAWPGMAMSKTITIDGQEYWYETFKADNNLNVILNQDGKQTADIKNISSDIFLRFDPSTQVENDKYAHEVLSGITGPATTRTVYCKTSESTWIQAWSNSNLDLDGNASGIKLMKRVTLDATTYFYEAFKENIINCCFQDGEGNKSEDITNITDDRMYETVYDYSAGVSVTPVSAPATTNTVATRQLTIYCKAESAPYLYATSTDWNQKYTADKGDKMTQKTTINGQEYWYRTFEDVDALNVIFTNGDWGDGTNQTGNFENIAFDTFFEYDGHATGNIINRDITIYCYASTAPYIWAWNGGDNLFGGWPGEKMIETDQTRNGKKLFKYTFTNQPSVSCLFHNNSGNQTGDLTNIVTDTYFEYDGNTTATRSAVTDIYVRADAAPYLYATSSDWQTQYNGNFPGSTLSSTTINGITYYHQTIFDTNVNLIFSDGESGRPTHQTEDITSVSGLHIYNFQQIDTPLSTTQDITIYLRADEAPEQPYIFANDENWNSYCGAFPGQKMTKKTTIDGTEYWYESFKSAKMHVIFSKGEGGDYNQTADITGITSSRAYQYKNKATEGNGANLYLSDISNGNNATIYVKKGGDNQPYLHMTTGSERTSLNGTFPGQQLYKVTSIGGQDYWYDTFLGSDFHYVISDGEDEGAHKSDEYSTSTDDQYYTITYLKSCTASQLPTVQTYAPSWAFIYEPLGFRLADNPLGTVAEFTELVSAAHEKEIGVVVGIEANSVSNKTEQLDDNVKAYLRSGANTYNHAEDWDMANREWITHHNVNVYNGSAGDYVVDLRTEETGLQNIVKNYLKQLSDVGVDGFCFYHAKYIGLKKGASYTNDDEGLGESPNATVVEGDTFWTNITDYIYKEGTHANDGLNLWAYGEIGVDPYYKAGDGIDLNNPNSYANTLSNPTNDAGRYRLVREYRNELDINDAYYTRQLIKDGGAHLGTTGYWEQKKIEEKLHIGMSVSDFLAGRRVANKSDLVYNNEYPDTYFEIYPEMYGKNGAQELLSSFDKSQAWMDRAYARIAGQDGSTIVYFARPGSKTAEIAPATLSEEALHFVNNKLIRELNLYHSLMMGMKEFVQDENEQTAIVRADGAVVIKRHPEGNDNINITNGSSTMMSNTYKDHISETDWTVNSTQLNGTMDADKTGVAVLYNEDDMKYRYFTVEPNSYTAPYTVFFTSGKVKIRATGNYDVRFWLANNEDFNSGSSYWGTSSTDYRTSLYEVKAGNEVEFEIKSSDFATSKNYRTPVYLRAYVYYNGKYYNMKQYLFELREENYKKKGDNSVFHVLYFKMPEDPAFDLSKFSVYAYSDQFGEALALTQPEGNKFYTDSEQWYRPVDLVYDGENFGTDTSYSDFVGNDQENYNPNKGASYCDIAGYPEVDSDDKYYRMTIGVPNLNFDVVKVVCSYNGQKLKQWTVDDDAFFRVEMKNGQVYVAPIRSLAGEALYDSSNLPAADKHLAMYYEPTITEDANHNAENVWSYTGQFQQGKKFRLFEPVDFQQNYMQGATYSTTYGTDGEQLFTQPLKVISTTHGVSLGGTGYYDSDAHTGLEYNSDYTQTQGYYLAENTSASGSTIDELRQYPSQEDGEFIPYSVSLSGERDLVFPLPTGTYRMELHERRIDDGENVRTEYYYTLSRPTLSVNNSNGGEVSRTNMELKNDLTGWTLYNVTVSDPAGDKGNQIVIRDVEDESVCTPVVYQVDRKDAGLSGEELHKNYSEAGEYRVQHIMGYKTSDGVGGETVVPAQDKVYLGFPTANIAEARDNNGTDWSGYWTTFSSGKGREIPSGATAYAVVGFSRKVREGGASAQIYLKQVTGDVPAETPLLLYYASPLADDITFGTNMVFMTDATTAGVAPETNLLRPLVAVSSESKYSEYDNYQKPVFNDPEGGYNYAFNYQQDASGNMQLGFFQATEATWPAQTRLTYRKAYLHLPVGDGEIPAVGTYDKVMFFGGDETTGIDDLLNDGTSMIETGDIYSLDGRKVSTGKLDSMTLRQLPKGIYIQNGKKFIVK